MVGVGCGAPLLSWDLSVESPPVEVFPERLGCPPTTCRDVAARSQVLVRIRISTTSPVLDAIPKRPLVRKTHLECRNTVKPTQSSWLHFRPVLYCVECFGRKSSISSTCSRGQKTTARGCFRPQSSYPSWWLATLRPAGVIFKQTSVDTVSQTL